MPPQTPDEQGTSRLAEVRAARIEKLQRLRELGIEPYPTSFPGRQAIADARARGESAEVRVAGRLMLWRRHGGSTFANLRDQSGQIQLQFRRDVLGPERYELTELLDIGDFVAAAGPLFTTKTGELTVEAQRFTLLTKSLRPLPQKGAGLTHPG